LKFGSFRNEVILHIDDDYHRLGRVDLIKMVWHVDLS
jgi:hypothetical protein